MRQITQQAMLDGTFGVLRTRKLLQNQHGAISMKLVKVQALDFEAAHASSHDFR